VKEQIVTLKPNVAVKCISMWKLYLRLWTM